MDAGGKIPELVHKRGFKSDGTRARSGAGRDLSFYTFFVSEVFFGEEGERLLRRS